MTQLWVGLDLGDGWDAAEVEHQVLDALSILERPPDYVVTHILEDVVSRAAVALRLTAGTADDVLKDAEAVYAVLGGTLVALGDGEPTVLGVRDAARECARFAAGSRDALFGRALRFPGQHRLLGVLSVEEIISSSAITKVTGSGWPIAAGDLVDTRGFVRPIFENGSLVLRVGPAARGLFIPNEIAEPRECCSGRH